MSQRVGNWEQKLRKYRTHLLYAMKVQHLLEAANIPVEELRGAIKRDKLVSWMLKKGAEEDGPPKGMNNYAEQFRRIRHLVIDNHHVRELLKSLNYHSPYPYETVRKEKPEQADEHSLMRAAQLVKNVMLAIRDSERRHLYGYGKGDMRQYASVFEDYSTHLDLPNTYIGFPGKPNARKDSVAVYAIILLGSEKLIGPYAEIDDAIRLGKPLRSVELLRNSMWRESRDGAIADAIESSKKYRASKNGLRYAVISTLATPDEVVVSSSELPPEAVVEHKLGTGYILKPGKHSIRYIVAYENGEKVDVTTPREVDTGLIDDIVAGIELLTPKLNSKLDQAGEVITNKPPSTIFSAYELANTINRCKIMPDEAKLVDIKFLMQLNALLSPMIQHTLEAGKDMVSLFAHNKVLHAFVATVSTHLSSSREQNAVRSFYRGDIDSAVNQLATSIKSDLVQGSLCKIWVYERRQTDSVDMQQVASWDLHTGKDIHREGIAVQKRVAEKIVSVLANVCGISDVPTGAAAEDKRKFFVEVLAPQVADLAARIQVACWAEHVAVRFKQIIENDS